MVEVEGIEPSGAWLVRPAAPKPGTPHHCGIGREMFAKKPRPAFSILIVCFDFSFGCQDLRHTSKKGRDPVRLPIRKFTHIHTNADMEINRALGGSK